MGLDVPEILLSGNHELIRKWRRKESLRRTSRLRPDLLCEVPLNKEDLKLLKEIAQEDAGGV
jgi:tRNA (guanine37-N1)-methyltransferase